MAHQVPTLGETLYNILYARRLFHRKYLLTYACITLHFATTSNKGFRFRNRTLTQERQHLHTVKYVLHAPAGPGTP